MESILVKLVKDPSFGGLISISFMVKEPMAISFVELNLNIEGIVWLLLSNCVSIVISGGVLSILNVAPLNGLTATLFSAASAPPVNVIV